MSRARIAATVAALGVAVALTSRPAVSQPPTSSNPSQAKAKAKSKRSTAGEFLYGVTDSSGLPGINGALLWIDPVNGRSKLIGDTGFQGIEAITYDSRGRLFATAYPGKGTAYHNQLIRINPATGKGISVAPVAAGDKPYYFVEALAFVDDVLYGSASTADSYCTDCSNHFIKIDTTTGQATEIGTFGPEFLNIEALAYSKKHGLIGADIGALIAPDFKRFHTRPALVRIDTATGRASKIADLPTDTFVCGLSFAPDGTLFGSTFPSHFGGRPCKLVKIDVTSGKITEVGDIGATNQIQNVDGIAYFSPLLLGR